MTQEAKSRAFPFALFLWSALTVALVLALRSLPWREAGEQLGRARLFWVAAAVVANFCVLPLWAIEWRLLARQAARIPFRTMFEVVSVTAAVLNTVPFFAGEATAVALLSTRAKLPRSAALSVLALDQLLVGFAKIATLCAAALLAPLPGWLRAGVTSLLLGVVALGTLLLGLAHRGERLEGHLAARAGFWPRVLVRVARLGRHLEMLKSPGPALAVAALALAKKSAELLGIIAIQMAFGLNVSVATALLTLAALSITTLLPVTPGNLAVYEATVFATYRYAGFPAETALGIAVVQHLCVLLPALSTGYVMLGLRQLLPQRTSVA